MTKFLFTTLPTNDLGLLTRSLPIAHELTARGHRILFCSPAKAPSQMIAEAGFENLLPRHPIYDLVAEGQDLTGLIRILTSGRWRENSTNLLEFLYKLILAAPLKSAPQTLEIWNMDHAAALMGMLNPGFVRANCEAFRKLLIDCQADVLVDFWNPFAVIAARSLKIPVIAVIQADAHPDNKGFIWWKTPPTDIPTPITTVNKVMAEHNLPPIRTLGDLSVGNLTLVVGTPETDPLPEHAEVTYIGPILWQKEHAELPAWIDDLSRDKPLIWLYSGNPRYSSNSESLDSVVILHACIAALANENMHVVVTTGHHPLPTDLLPLPANFHHVSFVPGLAMAARSDLLIHHGGYGSCQTGLYMGKPSVIMPTYSERESNARRIAALGAGAMVAVDTTSGKKQVNTVELKETVRRVLADPSYKTRAAQISEKMHAYRGVTHATETIEKFIHGPSHAKQ